MPNHDNGPAETPDREKDGDPSATQAEPARWHVLWTRSNCEHQVHAQLRAKGFELFLPTVGRWTAREKARRVSCSPLFPGYLFLRHAMDKHSYIEVSKARGLVSVLGERWDRLAAVPDQEIESIQKAVQSELPVMAHPCLRDGQRVRVLHGPMENVEGILLKSEPKRGLLVLSVELLRRSVAVQVEFTSVVPV